MSTTSIPSTSTPPIPSPSCNHPANPLICIIGPTGTGKSQLSVSIAQHFNGEIINADAMQMYAGLPIITNKIPVHEQHGVPHHMLGFIGLEEKPWTVRRFVDRARRVIEDVRGRGKVPIVVGGTGYYVHGLVVVGDSLLEGGEGKGEVRDVSEEAGENEVKEWGETRTGEGMEILQAPVEEMYDKLMEVDPEMARSWHPKDKRRIQRSLEIWLKTRKRASDYYREQRDKGGTEEGLSGLQYDTLMLWLDAEDDVLKERLNKRVDSMVADGLFEEALELYEAENEYERQGMEIDKGKGIWVSIGYKELERWAKAHAADPEANQKDSKLALECIEAVKAGTRQYAKRQNRYIRLRLANALKQAGELDKLFLIDSTDVTRWKETVEPQARELVSAFIEGRSLPKASTLSALARSTFDTVGAERSARTIHRCEVCDKTLMSEGEWHRHMASRSHKNVVQSQRKRALKGQAIAVRVVPVDVQHDLPP